MTVPIDVQDRFIRLGDVQLHYREWGDPSAPPLVLLHGVTSHARTWDRFAPAMAGSFRVLALDQRGHGESDWAPPYSTEQMAADLGAFAVALAIVPFTLVGHSMGGRNAFLYAAEQPDAVTRLVIVDIGPNGPVSAPNRLSTVERIRSAAAASFGDPEEAIALARVQNPRPSDEDRRRNVLANLRQRDDGRWICRYDAVRLAARTPRERAPDDEAQWELLARIACPTLLVRGAESDTLSRETAERMARVMPNCRLVEVEKAGHGIPGDNPEGFLAAVRPFLLSDG